MQPALGQAGGELRLTVFAVVQPADAGRGDGDERGVAGQRLLQVLIDECWRGRRWVVETDIADCFRRFRMRS